MFSCSGGECSSFDRIILDWADLKIRFLNLSCHNVCVYLMYMYFMLWIQYLHVCNLMYRATDMTFSIGLFYISIYIKLHFTCFKIRYARPSRQGLLNPVFPRFKRESEGGRSFTVSTTRLWNIIPINIGSKPSLASFKKTMFDHFKDSYKHLDRFIF